MKMIKLIGLAAAFMLTGCANVLDMAVSSKSVEHIVKSCQIWQESPRKDFPFRSVEECIISELERKDEALQRLGKPKESQELIAKIKEDQKKNAQMLYEHQYGTETIADLERKADEESRKRRQFGVCMIGTEAAYQDDLSSAYEAGDYEKVQLLKSKQYRYKLRKQCDDLIK
nr:MAG TPA: outer membrane protein assembly factor [Caudoviricetes sp.]